MSPSASHATPLARLLVPFFESLDRDGIRYCVLRGWSELPERTRNDVDLAVEPASLDRVEALLHASARRSGWLVVGRSEQPGFRRVTCFHPEHPGALLPVDLCSEHAVWGMVYADADEVLRSDLRHAGIRVARPGCEAAVSLLKGLLRHGVVKARADHRDRLRACVVEDPGGFRDACETRIGESACAALVEACARADWDGVQSMANGLRRQLARRRGRLRVLARAARARLRTRTLAWSRRGGLEFRGGLFVCLLGPDGSGKTTLSRALEQRIGPLFARTEQFHSLSGVLPRLGGLKKAYYHLRGRSVPDSPLKGVAMPGVVARPMPALRSATYILYYGLEYVLYRLTIRRKLRRNHLVIFDRYFYDYYLMRIHANAPRWLLDAFARCVARPDVLFVMLADPEAIFRRKPELTPEEIERQQNVLKSLRLPAAVAIDTSESVERTLAEALDAIVPRLRGEPIPAARS